MKKLTYSLLYVFIPSILLINAKIYACKTIMVFPFFLILFSFLFFLHFEFFPFKSNIKLAKHNRFLPEAPLLVQEYDPAYTQQ